MVTVLVRHMIFYGLFWTYYRRGLSAPKDATCSLTGIELGGSLRRTGRSVVNPAQRCEV